MRAHVAVTFLLGRLLERDRRCFPLNGKRARNTRVLDDVNTRSCAGSGCGSFCRGPLDWIPDGDCLWDLSLGQRTGEGKLEGRRFWIGC